MEYLPKSSHYSVDAVLGYGTQAIVFRAVYSDDQQRTYPCALKAINLDRSSYDLESLQQETKTLSLCKHKNVVPLFNSFVHSSYLWLVMPQLNASVYDLLATLQPIGFEESVIATIMLDVLHALYYLHSQNQLHRDVKLSNFLLNGAGETFLSDFGVAAMARPFSNQIKCQSFVGSPLYMSPEVANAEPYDKSADIWSFGICLYYLSHGYLPYQNLPPMEAMIAIIQKDAPKCSAKRNISKPFRDIIESCLVKRPADRPTADYLLYMKFWQKVVSKDVIADMVAEYSVLKPVKATPQSDYVVAANDILKKDGENSANYYYDSGFWDFDEVKVSKEEVSKGVELSQETDKKYPLDADVDSAAQTVEALFTELKMLRRENTVLKDENASLKARLYLFCKDTK